MLAGHPGLADMTTVAAKGSMGEVHSVHSHASALHDMHICQHHLSVNASGWPAHLVEVGHVLHLWPCAHADGSQDFHQPAQLIKV